MGRKKYKRKGWLFRSKALVLNKDLAEAFNYLNSSIQICCWLLMSLMPQRSCRPLSWLPFGILEDSWFSQVVCVAGRKCLKKGKDRIKGNTTDRNKLTNKINLPNRSFPDIIIWPCGWWKIWEKRLRESKIKISKKRES